MLLEEYERPRRPPRAPKSNSIEEEVLFVREALPKDLPSIRDIYNHYIRNSAVTFDEEELSLKSWRDKLKFLNKHEFPFLVAEKQDNQLIGFTFVAPWRQKSAFRKTVESSIYLAPAATGRGHGKLLLTSLLDACKKKGIKEVIAVISDKGADSSLNLHIQLGFREVGRMGKVGYKFGRWLGTIMLQKSLR